MTSRSTWACELKCEKTGKLSDFKGVTLHVSVWVEMRLQVYGVCKIAVTLHVSVWVEIFEYNPEICQL